MKKFILVLLFAISYCHGGDLIQQNVFDPDNVDKNGKLANRIGAERFNLLLRVINLLNDQDFDTLDALMKGNGLIDGNVSKFTRESIVTGVDKGLIWAVHDFEDFELGKIKLCQVSIMPISYNKTGQLKSISISYTINFYVSDDKPFVHSGSQSVTVKSGHNQPAL